MNESFSRTRAVERPEAQLLPGFPEVWGGVEPTVNRVGHRYLDQISRSGHDRRIEDLELFAELGITAIRYPQLWERTAPDGLDRADWRWSDERLCRLRELNLRPIVGLLHHGSGPRQTSLLDPRFPEQLAEYASAVARRYPWIQDYTPVNEPLTTARFSTLYGHWYPHDRSDKSFCRALIGQCRAVVLAMRAIREVNPAARLVQTEELGRVHSTSKLAYQADFENQRRWLTFDLLCGTLTPECRQWAWLVESGIAPEELQWFRKNPCPPDMLGVNYYLTSERFLDERHDLYPGELPGTNGIETYVDVSAARALSEPILGIGGLLEEVWDRYHIPIVITEVHNGSTREEQLRWLHEVWQHALNARRQGVDLRAITVWALLGSYDWSSLVTRDNGVYEPGAFDLRAPRPRPTALSHMTRALSITGCHDHPVLDVPGWWRRPDRFISSPERPQSRLRTKPDHTAHRTLLVIGDGSTLSDGIKRACEHRHIPATTLSSGEVGRIDEVVEDGRVWAVVLATDTPPEAARRVALVCRECNLPVMAFSTAGVFDGLADQPYTEGCPASPDSFLAREWVRVESEWLLACPTALVIRSGPLFGPPIPTRDAGLIHHVPISSAADVVSPTYIPDLANAAIDLLLDREQGIWHLANAGATSVNAFQDHQLDLLNLPRRTRQPDSNEQPRMRALSSERGWFLPNWRDALHRYVQDYRESILQEYQAIAAND